MSKETENNSAKKGGISVETAQIFPVIKKWLYSDKEIFLREILSNASDACTKLRRLCSLGEVHDIDENYRITVTLDKDASTITVSDNGIGMTEDEVERYICQIALSGAIEFIEKYEGDDAANGIIGHFGLGFYSAFMVSDTVEIVTRSYASDVVTHWVCDESGSYEITHDAERDGRGTDVILHVNEEGKEYLGSDRLLEVIGKYCAFMPIPIYFEDGSVCECDHDHDHEKDGEDGEEPCDHEPKPVNDTAPLWQKQPSECTDEEYKAFYGKVFTDFREPLFWVHINADYPLNFKGILYFPRMAHEYDSLEGQVKLFYNQVFVADNIKEVVPEYLLMLRGALDCPELPLNVSRSYLQSNGYVKKVSAHIVKKVADKLNAMFTNDREAYEKLWKDIKLFCEYASLSDKKFYDRVKGSLLYPLCGGGFVTLDEYLEKAKETHENTVYYATDVGTQAQYISLLSAQGIETVVLDKLIDNQYISMIESDRSGVKFVRVDAGLDALKTDTAGEERETLTALFREISGKKELTVKCEYLKDAQVPAVLSVEEQSRRLQDMMKMYTMQSGEDTADDFAPESVLTLNLSCPTVSSLDHADPTDRDRLVARQIWMLATLSQRGLSAEELKEFLTSSYEILGKL